MAASRPFRGSGSQTNRFFNEKKAGLLSIAVPWLAAGWLVRGPIAGAVLASAPVCLLLGSLAYVPFVRRLARKAIIERRRFLKALWNRGDPNAPPELSKPEEDIVKLLGRVKGV